ncbi:hypothetical protein CISG_00927 [Coccidioides immitis RMSCC 3703]|uniref:Uncharacterized protein n=1 Tax=Coccidioides immitis RMSCC 3703 TaxID=454286 RepID=A0A0J8QUP7_COCIT|nr:hypothetical protein CISG_00927 [Coccidioides immitis RMSCC 3703]
MALLSRAAAQQPAPEWRLQDKIYVGIIGPVMCAALLEWFLWLAAFIYCLYKVFVKADHWSVKLLAVIMAVLFSALRPNEAHKGSTRCPNRAQDGHRDARVQGGAASVDQGH